MIRREHIRFNEKEMKLALSMIEKLEKMLELLYYLIDHKGGYPFVMIMISADNYDLKSLLQHQKRESDMLYEIDRNENIYILICQKTKIEGGYRFAQRLIKNMMLDSAKDLYCAQIEVRSTMHEPKTVILNLLESYVEARQQLKASEIVFRSIG